MHNDTSYYILLLENGVLISGHIGLELAILLLWSLMCLD